MKKNTKRKTTRKKTNRGVKNQERERMMTRASFVSLLNRIAKVLKEKKTARVMIAGQRITIPASAIASVEFERDGDDCELEMQFCWKSEDSRD